MLRNFGRGIICIEINSKQRSCVCGDVMKFESYSRNVAAFHRQTFGCSAFYIHRYITYCDSSSQFRYFSPDVIIYIGHSWILLLLCISDFIGLMESLFIRKVHYWKVQLIHIYICMFIFKNISKITRRSPFPNFNTLLTGALQLHH